MKRPAKNVEEVDIEADVIAAPDTVSEEKVDATNKEVCVFDSFGKIIRIYSAEEHGKDYRGLAKQFIADRAGYSIK